MFPGHLLRNFPRYVVAQKFVSQLVRDGIEIRCCGELYKSWNNSNLKPHLSKPKKPDLQIRLEYLRTPKRDGKLKILAFHGCPGNAEHFRALGDTMHKLCGADFIIPSLPDISFTLETGQYYHSAEEKVEMVEALLQKLGITDIDLMVAHSAGSQPALLMTTNQKKIRVRSIALICSTTHKLIPAFQPVWLYSKLNALLHIPGVRKLIIPAFELRMSGSKLKKVSAIEGATSVASACATRYWYPDGMPAWIRDLNDLGFPRMAIYSSNDFVIPTRFSEDFVKLLGNSDRVNHYIYSGRTDADLRLVQRPLNGNLPPVVNFAEGGHNVMKQFPLTVADHLLRFVRSEGLI